MFFKRKKTELPKADQALQGRIEAMKISGIHYVNHSSMIRPFDDDIETIIFGLGCFWGAEKKFWQLDGVYTTAVGYSAGITPNPTYEEVCTGMTGHNEVVLVAYYPDQINFESLLKVFWESHDPTQGMRQGNDIGTQYRSGIYYQNEQQKQIAEESLKNYQQALNSADKDKITTEILAATEFYYAEEYHQQYLAKNPNGYCGLGGCGVSYFSK